MRPDPVWWAAAMRIMEMDDYIRLLDTLPPIHVTHYAPRPRVEPDNQLARELAALSAWVRRMLRELS